MHTDVYHHLVSDRRRRLAHHAAVVRARRREVSRSPRGRSATLRAEIGFRLVEAGLHLALSRESRDLGVPRSSR